MNSNIYKQFTYVTEKMINDSGGDALKMHMDTMFNFDNFCNSMLDDGFKVYICKGGCNSGYHDSPEHNEGKAIDFYFEKTPSNLWFVVNRLCYHRFHSVGVYLNQKRIYSFHADTGRYRQWGMWTDKNGTRHQVALIDNLQQYI